MTMNVTVCASGGMTVRVSVKESDDELLNVRGRPCVSLLCVFANFKFLLHSPHNGLHFCHCPLTFIPTDQPLRNWRDFLKAQTMQ